MRPPRVYTIYRRLLNLLFTKTTTVIRAKRQSTQDFQKGNAAAMAMGGGFHALEPKLQR
jgi:hypothetical protein